AGRDPNSQCVTIVNADTISPKIGPLLLGILQDHQTTCAYIAAAVVLVPTRRRKLEHIDLLATVDIFSDWALRYIDGLERLIRSKLLLPSFDHIQASKRRVQAKSQT